jgi:hypothetical protein
MYFNRHFANLDGQVEGAPLDRSALSTVPDSAERREIVTAGFALAADR